ncbi:MAG: hypothetical protein A3C03_01190 [Candidatus Colwellbacteria bacterium RIFCSPHIGHO2_02_FULL_45_17]|uniref:50S ribosomal protein L35 n=1 Tax=Candidatus Colwellbacteria bacterium RIFCSPLOWO2_12_FULL_46_17 TaxID=1797695 RepID=A0A1G1ZC18_9BACT|nr:MAG: hypothetical protein A3C03_01190 [Candidatus Colwellbacteria bacterium RIFCSPHIGHO2_02_FULL_45_17]OGY62198.1 MAG: hypothetical protein A3G58_02255 [Candidatus Colwellbacteria bacterium RIFCSPLOWO2_12_FULL_46_17]
MSATMTTKSFRKRFKITKTGKLMRRKQGQGHSRTNKSRKALRRKDGKSEVNLSDLKNISERLI